MVLLTAGGHTGQRRAEGMESVLLIDVGQWVTAPTASCILQACSGLEWKCHSLKSKISTAIISVTITSRGKWEGEAHCDTETS